MDELDTANTVIPLLETSFGFIPDPELVPELSLDVHDDDHLTQLSPSDLGSTPPLFSPHIHAGAISDFTFPFPQPQSLESGQPQNLLAHHLHYYVVDLETQLLYTQLNLENTIPYHIPQSFTSIPTTQLNYQWPHLGAYPNGPSQPNVFSQQWGDNLLANPDLANMVIESPQHQPAFNFILELSYPGSTQAASPESHDVKKRRRPRATANRASRQPLRCEWPECEREFRLPNELK